MPHLTKEAREYCRKKWVQDHDDLPGSSFKGRQAEYISDVTNGGKDPTTLEVQSKDVPSRSIDKEVVNI